MTNKRILITGSRDWDDALTIREALAEHASSDTVIVSGSCPKGADRICEEIAEELGLRVERHPAQWKTHSSDCPPMMTSGSCWQGRDVCKRAGFRRNAEMVKLGADLCLAFIKRNSHGARMTARMAESNGIPTVRYAV